VKLSFLGTRASRTHVYQGGQDDIVEGVANSFGTVISGAAIMDKRGIRARSYGFAPPHMSKSGYEVRRGIIIETRIFNENPHIGLNIAKVLYTTTSVAKWFTQAILPGLSG